MKAVIYIPIILINFMCAIFNVGMHTTIEYNLYYVIFFCSVWLLGTFLAIPVMQAYNNSRLAENTNFIRHQVFKEKNLWILIVLYTIVNFLVCFWSMVFKGHSLFNYQTFLDSKLYNPDSLIMYCFLADFWTLQSIPIILVVIFLLWWTKALDK